MMLRWCCAVVVLMATVTAAEARSPLRRKTFRASWGAHLMFVSDDHALDGIASRMTLDFIVTAGPLLFGIRGGVGGSFDETDDSTTFSALILDASLLMRAEVPLQDWMHIFVEYELGISGAKVTALDVHYDWSGGLLTGVMLGLHFNVPVRSSAAPGIQVGGGVIYRSLPGDFGKPYGRALEDVWAPALQVNLIYAF